MYRAIHIGVQVSIARKIIHYRVIIDQVPVGVDYVEPVIIDDDLHGSLILQVPT